MAATGEIAAIFEMFAPFGEVAVAGEAAAIFLVIYKPKSKSYKNPLSKSYKGKIRNHIKQYVRNHVKPTFKIIQKQYNIISKPYQII